MRVEVNGDWALTLIYCAFVVQLAQRQIHNRSKVYCKSASCRVSLSPKTDISTTCWYVRILHRLYDELHWLDVPERVTFKLGLMTNRCLHGQAPRYLADHVTPAIEVASRHLLRSANRHRLVVPRCRLNTYGRQAFPVADPAVWNSLPDELRDPACDVDSFKQFFKTILFSSY